MRKWIHEDGRYGDRKELNSYSKAAKWRELLGTLVANHSAEVTEDRKAVVLVNDMRGADFLHKLQLVTSSFQKIRRLRQRSVSLGTTSIIRVSSQGSND